MSPGAEEEGIFVLCVGDRLPFPQPEPWGLHNWNTVCASPSFPEMEAAVQRLIAYDGRVARIDWVPIASPRAGFWCSFFRVDGSKHWVRG